MATSIRMETDEYQDPTISQYLPAEDAQCRVEVFLQNLAPAESKQSQETIVDRLVNLRDAGHLREISLTVWGQRICTDSVLSTLDGGREIVNRIGDFYAFSGDSRVNISPFFQINKVESSITGESFQSIVPPSRCIAIYEGNRITGVFPCVIGDRTYSIDDALDVLEHTATDLSLSERPETTG